MEYWTLFEFIIIIAIYLILYKIGNYLFIKLENSDSRFLNPQEYLPEEELHTLKQVFYLVMMLLFFTFLMYIIISGGQDFYTVTALEIIVTIYIAHTLDYSSWKNKILFIFLIPYGALAFLIFKDSLVSLLDFVHIFVYIYLMKIYFEKFKDYTETNGLGITIILLFAIIFISFINTSIVENTGPFDAMVMVSNAFTSNGYAILGSSSLGKLNSIFLVWGGYILSGVGTATLTATILTKHFNKRFDELEKLIKEKDDD